MKHKIHWPIFIACAFFGSLPITVMILWGFQSAVATLLIENIIFWLIATYLMHKSNS